MEEIKYKDTIIKIIEIYFPDAEIYLFGSYARKSNKPGSDIDIAIDAGKRLTLEDLKNMKRLIDALPLSQGIDLVDINRVPPQMKQDISNEGIQWK
jgi:uncharacterized protein